MSLEEESEIEFLKKQSCYIAGFTEQGSETHTSLYDVFINGNSTTFYWFIIIIINWLVSAGTITINPDSKGK